MRHGEMTAEKFDVVPQDMHLTDMEGIDLIHHRVEAAELIANTH